MKQIFDWLREHLEETANDVSPNTDKLVVLDRVERLINEAEAKWEAECCEWGKHTSSSGIFYITGCGHLYDDAIRYCPFCGKPIKISEVE